MERRIVETYYDIESIEKKIIEFNENHYKQVFLSEVYTNKIYKELLNNNTRDKILARRLKRNECDNSKVYKFLQLLKR